MKNKIVPSEQTQQEAMKIAKATQKPGQSKEQTKLVAQGIEKGIAQYKKQQKERNRQADKAKKKEQKEKAVVEDTTRDNASPVQAAVKPSTSLLPWGLLLVSWIGFVVYLTMQ